MRQDMRQDVHTGQETGRAHGRQDCTQETGQKTGRAHRRQNRRHDVHTGDRTGDRTCTLETRRAHRRHDVHTGDRRRDVHTGDKVTDQTRLSKPRKAPPKPRPTIGQSPVHATQYTGRLAARPPTRPTSGKRRAICQQLRGTLIPSNKRKDKKSITNAYSRKVRERKRLYTNACGEERKNRPQMPRAKKERPNHKRWWQTKNGCPNQASKRKMAALIRQANS